MWPRNHAPNPVDSPSPGLSRPRLVKHRKPTRPIPHVRTADALSSPFRDAHLGSVDAGLSFAFGRETTEKDEVFVFGSSSKKSASGPVEFDLRNEMRSAWIGDEMARLNIEGADPNPDGDRAADRLRDDVSELCIRDDGGGSSLYRDMGRLNVADTDGKADEVIPDEAKSASNSGRTFLDSKESTRSGSGSANTDGKHFDVFGSGRNAGDSISTLHGDHPDSRLPEDRDTRNVGGPGRHPDFDKEDVLAFASDKNTGVNLFSSDVANVVLEGIERLNVGTSHKGHSEKEDLEARTVGYSSKRVGIDVDENMKLPKDMEKLSIGDSASVVGGPEKIEGKSQGNKWDYLRFSAGSVGSDGAGENRVNFPSGEVRHHSENKMENVAGQLDDNFSHAGDFNGSDVQSQFIFQAQRARTFAATGIPFKQNDTAKVSSGPSQLRAGSSPATSGFTFTASREGQNSLLMDDTIPKDFPWSNWSARENVFLGGDPSISLNTNVGVPRDAKKNSRRNKLKQVIPTHPKRDDASLQRQNSLHENIESGSPGSYSPMDFSPYENLVPEQISSEVSVDCNKFIPSNSCNLVGAGKELNYGDLMEDLVFKAQSISINEFHMEDAEPSENGDDVFSDINISANAFLGLEPVQPLSSASDDSGFNDLKKNSMEIPVVILNESKANDIEPGDRSGFTTDDTNKPDFSISSPVSASPSTQGQQLASKHLNEKKNRMKTWEDSNNSNQSTNFHSDSSSSTNSMKIDALGKQEPNLIVSTMCKTDEEVVHQVALTTGVAKGAVQEICEKWRLRGNQAYAVGDLAKAEEYYTCGVECVSMDVINSTCMRELMLCHSNRAATRMALGRMREALKDCVKAIAIDPNFLKVYVRAGNCHLALGETDDACRFFEKCIQLADNDSRRVLEEASDGLQKAQQAESYIGHSAELLKTRSTNCASDALPLISNSLELSPYSEKLIEMKADALLMLRRYEEVIELCEQTMDSSKKNVDLANHGYPGGQSEEGLSGDARYCYQEIWRWNLISKSYFYLGRLEEALNLLEKNMIVGLSLEMCSNKSMKSLASFSATLQELVHLKGLGNTAFQANRHLEAVEHYTAALGCSTESRPFSAICFCNRAAAYQALGQVTDAIADCSLAIALDGTYAKAISRRATLHEMIRDYSQAVNDLNRLILLLDKKLQNSSEKFTSDANDLKRARLRLPMLEDEARKGTPLDLYMIMGVESSSSAADIRKAYRKAALRHHPDKACKLLARTENSEDGLWKEVADEVHKYADRLFKIIGEAYAVLSDVSKRLQYDAEEEMRTVSKTVSANAATKHAGESRSNHSEKSTYYSQSGYSRQPWNTRRSSGSSQEWWSESSRSHRNF